MNNHQFTLVGTNIVYHLVVGSIVGSLMCNIYISKDNSIRKWKGIRLTYNDTTYKPK